MDHVINATLESKLKSEITEYDQIIASKLTHSSDLANESIKTLDRKLDGSDIAQENEIIERLDEVEESLKISIKTLGDEIAEIRTKIISDNGEMKKSIEDIKLQMTADSEKMSKLLENIKTAI